MGCKIMALGTELDDGMSLSDFTTNMKVSRHERDSPGLNPTSQQSPEILLVWENCIVTFVLSRIAFDLSMATDRKECYRPGGNYSNKDVLGSAQPDSFIA